MFPFGELFPSPPWRNYTYLSHCIHPLGFALVLSLFSSSLSFPSPNFDLYGWAAPPLVLEELSEQ